MATNSPSSLPSVADNTAKRMPDTILLTCDPLSVEKATDAVASNAAGATSVFVGTTRDTFEGKLVTLLQYEAYESMALKEMTKLCESARGKWPDLCSLAVMHRLGRVAVGEASVIIAASSPHRKEAIDACHFLIDTLKATVPIWKKEVYEDGSTWKANKEFDHK